MISFVLVHPDATPASQGKEYLSRTNSSSQADMNYIYFILIHINGTEMIKALVWPGITYGLLREIDPSFNRC